MSPGRLALEAPEVCSVRGSQTEGGMGEQVIAIAEGGGTGGTRLGNSWYKEHDSKEGTCVPFEQCIVIPSRSKAHNQRKNGEEQTDCN